MHRGSFSSLQSGRGVGAPATGADDVPERVVPDGVDAGLARVAHLDGRCDQDLDGQDCALDASLVLTLTDGLCESSRVVLEVVTGDQTRGDGLGKTDGLVNDVDGLAVDVEEALVGRVVGCFEISRHEAAVLEQVEGASLVKDAAQSWTMERDVKDEPSVQSWKTLSKQSCDAHHA